MTSCVEINCHAFPIAEVGLDDEQRCSLLCGMKSAMRCDELVLRGMGEQCAAAGSVVRDGTAMCVEEL